MAIPIAAGPQPAQAGRPHCQLATCCCWVAATMLTCPHGRWKLRQRPPCPPLLSPLPPPPPPPLLTAGPPLMECCAEQELPFGNPLFAAPGLSPSPAQNPVFSPATFGTAPQSAVGMRRLGVLPPSQLQAAAGAAARESPATSDAAMADEGYMDDEEGGQPPADSLAVASPGAAGAAGGRERPEEDEFASVLGAGEWDSVTAPHQFKHARVNVWLLGARRAVT